MDNSRSSYYLVRNGCGQPNATAREREEGEGIRRRCGRMEGGVGAVILPHSALELSFGP